MFRGLPFLRLEITRHIVGGRRSARDGHEKMLKVWKRQAFERPEHPVLVNDLERHSHVIQFSGLWGDSPPDTAPARRARRESIMSPAQEHVYFAACRRLSHTWPQVKLEPAQGAKLGYLTVLSGKARSKKSAPYRSVGRS